MGKAADLKAATADLAAHADNAKAEHAARYFKTGPGEYGEGDRFRGVRVPVLRRLARKYWTLPLPSVETLLISPYHEDRLFALLCMIRRFQKGDERIRTEIFEMYVLRMRYVNNWDLVDTSAPHIVGAHLRKRDRSAIHDLARSPSIWERRIAMMATFHFIKQDDFADALGVARVLLRDPEDLIHKAVGWMLREIGSRNEQLARDFLNQHHLEMPRTMLRYAIEKLPDDHRRMYLPRPDRRTARL